MKNGITGIHHITAIAGDAQKNVDFYVKTLGLRMIKRTVNFDDPFTYHLYYGDQAGTPGTILTFFPWGKGGFKGKRGTGQATTISYSLPENSAEYWKKRLADLRVDFIGPYKRFDEFVMLIEDADRIESELIFSAAETRDGWDNGEIPPEHAIRGFFGVTMALEQIPASEKILIDQLGFTKIKEEKNRIRYQSGAGGAGTYTDIISSPELPVGRMGVGTVHHTAWRANDNNHQLELRKNLVNSGMSVTPVIDRNYFHSIYFREPGNILFEIATDPPGFSVDEQPDELGSSLKLPPWLEPRRSEIENVLPEIKLS